MLAGAALLAEPHARARWLARLRGLDWVVYVKRPFAGPEQVLDYLGRYTHGVALANDRLVSLDDGVVRIRWKDYADHDRQKVLALAADEFLRRFLLHVLPRGFMRIRHFGLLANRTKRASLDRCRHQLAAPAAPAPPVAEPLADVVRRLRGLDLTRCAVCGLGRMQRTVLLAPRRWARPRPPAVDTS